MRESVDVLRRLDSGKSEPIKTSDQLRLTNDFHFVSIRLRSFWPFFLNNLNKTLARVQFLHQQHICHSDG